MVDEYQCPKCKPGKIKIGYPNIECLSCGWQEPLVDYPISWNWHRSLCIGYRLADPGPCEPPEHSIEELHERILALEERPQLSEKLKSNVQPHKKPQSKLYGGVRL